jgi:transcriptional regulator with XRE-family HTH domain
LTWKCQPVAQSSGHENGGIEDTLLGMTSSFQFGSRQKSGVDSTSDTHQSSSTSVGASSTRDIGALLRERREALGVTLAETEAATRIRQKYLAALESDEWHLLPGEVVGRGFLRNYSAYLGLEPTDVIERRRATTGDSVTLVLANTSAGSSLPPIRQVDYRPKEVELLDEGEGMERREIRFGPILSVLAAIMLLLGAWLARGSLSGIASGAGDIAAAAFENMRAMGDSPTSVEVAPNPDAGIVNPENAGVVAVDDGSGDGGPEDDGETVQPPVEEVIITGPVLIPTPTPTLAPPTPTIAADTTLVEPIATPTETPVPLPTPTDETIVEAVPIVEEAAPPEEDAAILLPTATPEAVEAVIVASSCPDPRSVITSPGVTQAVTGVIGVTGSATHETFQYYKLEYAPGANAGGGYVYFDGGDSQVSNGLLGNLNTTLLPNGLYTVQLIVVDGTGNFPPPCSVTIDLQN